MDLQEIRAGIDAVDGELVALFQRRMELSRRVAEYKLEAGLPVLDAGREREVVARAEAAVADGALKPHIRRLFEDVMAVSRELQQRMLAERRPADPTKGPGRAAYLGPEGSFSHEAALRHFDGADLAPQAGFDDIVAAVQRGDCRWGLLPVENSLTGGVFPAADLLASAGVTVVGETVLPVRHCLLGVPGSVREEIKLALSHPQPLEQCRRYLLRAGIAGQARSSTAEAAREVLARGDRAVAAVASAQAGRLYGLRVLEADIQDDGANYTRFAVIARRGEPAPGPADKVSMIFVVEHRPGALCAALGAFSDRGINILSLVSRPIAGEPWHYCFHMDFEGSLEDGAVRAALAEAGASCRSIQILGNYGRWRG